MPRGRYTLLALRLTPAEEQALTAIAAAWERRPWEATRARLILLVAHDTPISTAARVVGLARKNAYRWLYRFIEERVPGLASRPRGPAAHRETRTHGH
jgi:transposase-like protein